MYAEQSNEGIHRPVHMAQHGRASSSEHNSTPSTLIWLKQFTVEILNIFDFNGLKEGVGRSHLLSAT